MRLLKASPRTLAFWNSPIFLRNLSSITVLLLLAMGVGIVGFLLIFNRFFAYDDEGYVLYSLKNFLAGHALYNEVYSQYGPLYFFTHKFIMGSFNLEPTHNVIRLITLSFWLAGCLFLSLGIQRLTQSLLLGVLALFSVFINGVGLVSEPGHPQGMIFTLICFTVFLASLLPKLWVVVAFGVITGIVFLTKANIGIFLLASLSWAFLCADRSSRVLTTFRVLCGLGILLLPMALMRDKINESQILVYALISTATTFNLIISFPKSSFFPPKTSLPFFWSFLLGFGTTVIAGIFLTLVSGTPPASLYEGVIGQHIRFGDYFFINFPLQKTMLISAVIAVIVCIAYHFFLRGRSNKALDIATFSLKALFVGTVIFLMGKVLPNANYSFFIDQAAYLIPWMWLLMLPHPRKTLSIDHIFQRYSLLSVATLQFLVAYPVAGSQKAWSILLTIPISLILLADLMDLFHNLRSKHFAKALQPKLFYLFLIIIFSSGLYKIGIAESKMYAQQVSPITLAGSSLMRLPEQYVTTFEGLNLNLQANADSLITLPGMYSFSLWSGVDSPTLQNLTAWPYGFNEAKQQAIVQQAAPISRLVGIRYTSLLEGWNKSGDSQPRPLVQYVENSLEPVAVIGDYELLARPQNFENFCLIGGWWISPDELNFPEADLKIFKDNSVILASVNLPQMEGTFHRVEVYNVTAFSPVTIANFPDEAKVGLVNASGEISKISTSWLQDNGISLKDHHQLVLPLMMPPPQPGENGYVIRLFDSSDQVLLRLPFIDNRLP
jgi:hypothetical protein